MRKRLLGYAAAGVVLLAVSAWSAYVTHSRAVKHANFNFTLKDMNGADVRLSDFKGKPLLLNFWGTWCPPCVLEAPELVELANEYKSRGVVVVGIAYNDTPEDVRRFAAEYKVPYPLLIWKDEVLDAFGVTEGFPTSIFIRPDGRIMASEVGLNTKAWFQQHLEALLAN